MALVEGFKPIGLSFDPAEQKKHSDAGWEWESAKSNYLSNLARIPAAMGLQAAEDYANEMEALAKIERSRSAAPGSWDEMEFGKNFGAYLRQGAIQSAPYMAEAVATAPLLGATGVARGLSAAGVRTLGERAAVKAYGEAMGRASAKQVASGVAHEAAVHAAQSASEQAIKNGARGIGLVAGTYPSSVGDVLSNQSEESGRYNLGAAAALGVPYAAMNLLGLEGMAGGVQKFARGGLARGLGAAATTMGGEALNETGQEVMNQFGRMAVNPNATLTSGDALQRYKESAIMGGLLGGLGGAGHVGSSMLRKPIDPTGEMATDLLGRYEGQYQKEQAQLLRQQGLAFDTGREDSRLPLMEQFAALQERQAQRDYAASQKLTPLQEAQLAAAQESMYAPAWYQQIETRTPEPTAASEGMRYAQSGQTLDMFAGQQGTDSPLIQNEAPASPLELRQAYDTALAHLRDHTALAEGLESRVANRGDQLKARAQATQFAGLVNQLDAVSQRYYGAPVAELQMPVGEGQTSMFGPKGGVTDEAKGKKPAKQKAAENLAAVEDTTGDVTMTNAAPDLTKEKANGNASQVVRQGGGEGQQAQAGAGVDVQSGAAQAAQPAGTPEAAQGAAGPVVQTAEAAQKQTRLAPEGAMPTTQDDLVKNAADVEAVRGLHAKATEAITNKQHSAAIDALTALMDIAGNPKKYKGDEHKATREAAKAAAQVLAGLKAVATPYQWRRAEHRANTIRENEVNEAKGGEGVFKAGEKPLKTSEAIKESEHTQKRQKKADEAASEFAEETPTPVASAPTTTEQAGKDIKAALKKLKVQKKSAPKQQPKREVVDEIDDGEYHEEDRDVLTAQDEGAFTRGAAEGSGPEAIRVEAEKQLAGKKGRPALTVVKTAKELPFDAPDDAKGAVYKGRLYLVADNVSLGEDLGEVLRHELVHHGLRGFFGRPLDAVLNLVHSINPTIRKYAAEWVNDNQDLIQQSGWDEETVTFKSIDEAMARMGQNGKAFNGARRVAAKVQELLRSVGLDKLANLFEAASDAEAAKALYQARTYVEYGKVQATGTANLDPAFSRAVSYAEKVAGPSGKRAVVDTAHLLKKLGGSLEFLGDAVKRIEKTLPSVRAWYDAYLAKQATRFTHERIADNIAALASGLDTEQYRRTNEFMADSTFDQKWAYQPTWKSEKVTVDPEMAKRWNALTEEERKVIDAVFKHGHDFIAEVTKLLKDLGVDATFNQFNQLSGPYAPLKRFGDYVAVGKSAELVAAEKAVEDEPTQANQKKVDELKSDPKHFVSSRFDTKGQAQEFADDIASDFPKGTTYAFEAPNQIKADAVVPYQAFQKILEAVKADKLDPKVKSVLEDTVKNLFLSSAQEFAARQGQYKRKFRAGFEQDMMRSFLHNARANAIFLSNLEHGGDINEAYFKLEREARRHRDADADFNLITNHYADALNYKPTPIQDAITGWTSVWQLATSIGYHVTNATQVLMVTLPRIAADFGDYRAAWRHVMNGYGLMKAMGGKNIDLSKIQDKGLREALQRIQDLGQLDVGMEEDLTHLERMRTGYAAVDAVSGVASSAVHRLRQVSRTVEMWNRVVAASAAYSMAKEHGKSSAEAGQYAQDIVANTQGDFTRIGAPLLLKKLPKFTVQYRKYQFLMAALYSKAFREAFAGATPEERAVGRRMLAFKMFHTAMAAGALGLPLMNVAAMLFAAGAGDDDEPANFEKWLREKIDNKPMADLLLHGPLAALGLDTSAKLGDDKIFSIMPYNDWDFSSGKAAMQTIGALAGGPTGAQAGKIADAAALMRDGQFYKGVEAAMPKGVTDAMRAFRIANEGYTLKNGDLLVGPEDFTAFTIAMQAVGLPPTQLKDLARMRSLQFDVQKFYTERTKEIEHDYARAIKEGNSEKAAEMRDHWRALQASKSEWRPVFGNSHDYLKPQPMSNLLRYPQSVNKRTKKEQSSAGYANM